MGLESLNVIVPVIVIGSIVLFLGIFALAFGPFLMRMMKESSQNKALVQGGKTAPATMISMQQTGAEISSGGFQSFEVVIQLQVQPSDGAPFIATASQFLPLLELQQMQTGCTLVVRYSPANTSQVAIVHNLGNIATAVQADGMDVAAAQKLVLDSQLLEDDLSDRGIAAPAEVIAADKMGVRLYNGASELMNLTLDIQPAQGTSFRSQAQAAIVQASLGKYAAGAKVNVKYDPADTNRVILVGAR